MDFLFQIMPLVLMLLGLGSIAGFLAGLLGVGGGIVLVPGLYAVFSLSHSFLYFDPEHLMHICVATSLAIIVPTGISSAYAHYKRKSVDFPVVFWLGMGVILGVLFSTWLVKFIDIQGMRVIFATSVVVLAFIMMRGAMKKESELRKRGSFILSKKSYPFIGVFIGAISALIGIGGATLSVPFMSGQNISMHRAVGTASALGVVIALPASLGFMVSGQGLDSLPPFSAGYVNVLAWLCVIPASIAVAPFGASYAHKLPVKKLKFGFAFFVLIIALNMWRKILIGG